MKFGIVGLGRMGSNLALRAAEKGHQVVGYDRMLGSQQELKAAGVELAASLQDLVTSMPEPRIVFVYVPHGTPTEEVCRSLHGLLSAGDIIADGGNSHWEDSSTRHDYFADAGIRFLDIGTSGGVHG